VSWARQSNSQIDSRDFSGLTGSIIGTYAPTAKVSLNATLSRDAGVNGTLFTLSPSTTTTTPGAPAPVPVRGLSESSQITNSASLGATYEVTSKISLNAGAHWRHAKLVDTAPVAGTTTLTTYERSDNSRNYSLGLTWAISRGWDLGCSLARSTRDLDASPITAGISYTANVASCYAQFMLR
jgi:outer membrane receptor protein involved in Fe transport